MIPRQMVEDYRKALESVSGKASDELGKLWSTLNQFDVDDIQDILRMSMVSLTAKYGDVAALISAQFYENIRAYQRGGTYNAQLADNYADKMNAMMGGASLTNKPKEELFNQMLGMLDRYVLQAGRDTITQNSYRDPLKPRVARIPQGAKTCAFCLMLAARGFVYASKASAGNTGGIFNDYHDYCDCATVIDFTDDPRVEGYDPADRFYDIYRDSRNSPNDEFDNLPDFSEKGYGSDEENTRLILAKIRRKFPNDVTDGVFN